MAGGDKKTSSMAGDSVSEVPGTSRKDGPAAPMIQRDSWNRRLSVDTTDTRKRRSATSPTLPSSRSPLPSSRGVSARAKRGATVGWAASPRVPDAEPGSPWSPFSPFSPASPTASPTASVSIASARNAFSKDKLKEELRQKRSKSNFVSKTGVDVKAFGANTEVPIQAYSAPCGSFDRLCGIEASACKKVPVVRQLVENRADMASAVGDNEEECHDAEQRRTEIENMGYPTLEKAGWWLVESPKMMRQLLDPEQRMHFQWACEMFEFSFLQRHGEEKERVMLTFEKSKLPSTAKQIKQALTILKEVDHVNVAKLLSVCETETHLYLVYEGAEGMGYLPYRVITHKKPLSASEGARLLQQLAAAAAYADEKGISHLSMSMWDVWSTSYEGPFPIKLFGLGLAGLVYTGLEARTHADIRQAFCCRAPELCKVWLEKDVVEPYRRLGRNPMIDVYSIGAICYTTLSAHLPFGGTDEVKAMHLTISRPPLFDADFAHVEPSGVELLQLCLKKNPSLRPKLLDLIVHRWTRLHLRSSIDPRVVEGCIQRLREFAAMSPVKRLMGKLVAKNLRAEQRRCIEDMFNTVDVMGDGELDAGELGAFFSVKAEDMQKLLSVLDGDGNARLSLSEFMVANVFADEVLTERVLYQTFDELDADGSGEMTALELYSSLMKLQPDLRVEDVANFLGDADTDWNANVDFDEFRTLFPQVKYQWKFCADRADKSRKLSEVLKEVFEIYKCELEVWRMTAGEEIAFVPFYTEQGWLGDKATAEACTIQWATKVQTLVKKIQFFFKNAPTAKLSEELTDKYTHASSEGQKKKSKSKKAHHGSNTKFVGQILPDDTTGPYAIGAFFTLNKSAWSKRIHELVIVVKNMMAEDDLVTRRTKLMQVLDDIQELYNTADAANMEFVEEQEAVLLAADTEPTLPRLSTSPRNVPPRDISHDAAEEAIRENHAARQAEEARRKREAQEELAYKQQVSTYKLRGQAYRERRQGRSGTRLPGTVSEPLSAWLR